MGGEGRFVEMAETKTFEKFEFSESVNDSEFCNRSRGRPNITHNYPLVAEVA